MAISNIYTALGLTDPSKQKDILNQAPPPVQPAQPTQPQTALQPTAGDLQPIQPGQNVQLQAQPAGVQGTGQGQVINAAQQQALQGFQSPTAQMTSQQTQNLLQDPNQGFDPAQLIRLGMDTDARARAEQLDKWLQSTAPLAPTGARNKEFAQLALESAMERGDLEKSLGLEAVERGRQNLLEAIQQGVSTTNLERGIASGGIADLIAAAGAGEAGEQRAFTAEQSDLDRTFQLDYLAADTDAQKALTEFKGKIDTEQLILSRDYDVILEKLRNANAQALQQGDIAGQMQIQTMIQDFQGKQAQADRDEARYLQMAQQSWQTGENVRQEDLQKSLEYAKIKANEAAQDKDIAAQDRWRKAENDLQLTMQTRGMDFEQKMAYLNDELANATADKDVNRQKDIIGYQSLVRMNEMATEYSYDAALQMQQGEIQAALNAGEYAHAEAMQQAQFTWQANENYQDRLIQMKSQALTEAGMNMDWIETQVANGNIDPQQALDYLNTQMTASGITFTTPDPDSVNAAIDAQFNSMQYQFLQTNPEYAGTGDQILSDEGVTAFNEWYNEQTYGADSNIINDIVNGVITGTELASDPAKYEDAYSDAPRWEPQITYNDGGPFGEDYYEFSNIPTGPFKYQGKLYIPTAGATVNYEGENYAYFTATDASTGQTVQIKTDTTNNFGGENGVIVGNNYYDITEGDAATITQDVQYGLDMTSEINRLPANLQAMFNGGIPAGTDLSTIPENVKILLGL